MKITALIVGSALSALGGCAFEPPTAPLRRPPLASTEDPGTTQTVEAAGFGVSTDQEMSHERSHSLGETGGLISFDAEGAPSELSLAIEVTEPLAYLRVVFPSAGGGEVWLLSGPSNVTFTATGALHIDAPLPGTYALRLADEDGIASVGVLAPDDVFLVQAIEPGDWSLELVGADLPCGLIDYAVELFFGYDCAFSDGEWHLPSDICQQEIGRCESAVDTPPDTEANTDMDDDGYHTDGPEPLDCDDADDSIHPGAQELCDRVDNNCDGLIDTDAVDALVWYVDADDDGFRGDDQPVVACEQPVGYIGERSALEDCDDSDDSVNPDADEVCDAIDNDCDGVTDDDAVDSVTYYVDGDGDGYGWAEHALVSCEQPSGYVMADPDQQDCDDTDELIHPDAEEVWDGSDDDCDALVDEGVISVWYADWDEDGYGDPASELVACEWPDNYAANASDCDDTSDSVHPGVVEVCDAIDNNCDDVIDEDGVCLTYTLTEDIQPLIFDVYCTSCHSEGVARAGLELQGAHAFDNLVDVPSEGLPDMDLIEAGDPDNSYLWHKVSGTHLDMGGVGETMPLDSTLSAALLEMLETWILEGVPE